MENIYYVGFNANNAIKNESFFKGSITLYPTKEKGNIYFSDSHIKLSKEELNAKYKAFVEATITDILSKDPNAKIMCFNKRAKAICEKFKNYFTKSNDDEIVDMLNDKFKTRELVKDDVPILEYYWVDKLDMSYEEIVAMLNSNQFVVQAVSGAGGDTTFNIKTKSDYDNIKNSTGKFCISKYVKNTPLNVTAVIGDKDILLLPISTQLILKDHDNFTYVGGDFEYANNLSSSTKSKVNTYSLKILNKIKSLGYRGIIGIDYILFDNNILFMEINPRFQASTFLINMKLEEQGLPNMAKLNYDALNGGRLPNIDININQSFLNCNDIESFNQFDNYKCVYNGYSKFNSSSIYRKVYDYSVLSKSLKLNLFEHE